MTGRAKSKVQIRLRTQEEPLVSVQFSDIRKNRGEHMKLNATIVQMAEAEYERQYPPGQTIDELRERSGLGFGEVIMFLAEALARYAPEDALIPKSLTNPVPLPWLEQKE